MSNITLISTRHENVGACNSDALCHILGIIRPDVIFEEMPPSSFDQYYIECSRRNLETDAISKFLLTNDIEHVPVDLDDIPDEAFFQAHRRAFEKVERLPGQDGFDFRNLVDKNKYYASIHGFAYLNSDYSIAFNDEIFAAIEPGLQEIDNEELLQACRRWDEVIDQRENEMLKNIYQYSNDHPFNNAVFLLGASHRKSIIEKVKNYRADSGQKLNWSFYGQEDLKPVS